MTVPKEYIVGKSDTDSQICWFISSVEEAIHIISRYKEDRGRLILYCYGNLSALDRQNMEKIATETGVTFRPTDTPQPQPQPQPFWSPSKVLVYASIFVAAAYIVYSGKTFDVDAELRQDAATLKFLSKGADK